MLSLVTHGRKEDAIPSASVKWSDVMYLFRTPSSYTREEIKVRVSELLIELIKRYILTPGMGR